MGRSFELLDIDAGTVGVVSCGMLGLCQREGHLATLTDRGAWVGVAVWSAHCVERWSRERPNARAAVRVARRALSRSIFSLTTLLLEPLTLHPRACFPIHVSIFW